MMASRIKDLQAERLAAALRENLKRRKAQARGRKAGDVADKTGETDKVSASEPISATVKD